MTDESVSGGSARRTLAQFVKRDLPERAKASEWCGRHDKSRTRLVLRRSWVCLDCASEASRDDA